MGIDLALNSFYIDEENFLVLFPNHKNIRVMIIFNIIIEQ